MAVYVDSSKHRLGLMIMSHMWADDEGELLAFCDKIGFDRAWIQRPGVRPARDKKPARWLHCDVSQMMRARAVEAGAIQTDLDGPLEHVSKLALADPNAPEHAKAQARARLETIRQTRERTAR